jgi:hypothetical protein
VSWGECRAMRLCSQQGKQRLTDIIFGPMVQDMEYEPPKTPLMATICAMEPKSAHLFRGATPESIKTLVSRARARYPKRRYRTAKHTYGVAVWRDK